MPLAGVLSGSFQAPPVQTVQPQQSGAYDNAAQGKETDGRDDIRQGHGSTTREKAILIFSVQQGQR